MPSRESKLAKLVAQRIREAREAAGLTRTQAAAAMGVSERTWADYERGIIGVGMDDLEMIADVTRQPVSFFIDGGAQQGISRQIASLVDRLDPKDQSEIMAIVRLKLRSLPKAGSRRQAKEETG